MELNTMQIKVAQIFEGGIYGPGRTLEDAQNQDDTLFLFLLQEAENCSDTGDMKERITVTMDRLRDLRRRKDVPQEPWRVSCWSQPFVPSLWIPDGYPVGENITLHASAGLDAEGQTCFAIILPH